MIDPTYNPKNLEQIAQIAAQAYSSDLVQQGRYLQTVQAVLQVVTCRDDPEAIIDAASARFSSNLAIQARFRGAFLQAYLDIDPYFGDTIRWQASESGEKTIRYPSAYLYTRQNGIQQVGNIFPYLLEMASCDDVLTHYVYPRLEERFEKQVKDGFDTPHTMYSWITPYTQDCSFLESYGTNNVDEQETLDHYYFSILIPEKRLSDIVHQMLERPHFVARALLHHCLGVEMSAVPDIAERRNIIQRVERLYIAQPGVPTVLCKEYTEK